MGEKKNPKERCVTREEGPQDGDARVTKKKKKIDVDGGFKDKKSSSNKRKLDLKDQENVESIEKSSKIKSKKEKCDKGNISLQESKDESLVRKKEKKKKQESSRTETRKEAEMEQKKDETVSNKMEQQILEKDAIEESHTKSDDIHDVKKPKKRKKEQKEVITTKEMEGFLFENEGVQNEKKRKKEKHKSKNISDSKLEQSASIESDKDSAVHQALLYLQIWKSKHSEWTFKKVRQVWLLKNMYDDSKIPDEDFNILLEYLEGLKGVSRQTTIDNAESMINNESDASENQVKLKRAKRLLQILA